MSSARLPGKMLREIEGVPLLGYVVERLRTCLLAEDVVVATSDEASDDPLAALCRTLGIKCFRGALDDVAGRFLRVIDALEPEAFVRISGDSPLIDPAIVDQVIGMFEDDAPDLAVNIHPRSFPKGQSVEVVRSTTFRAALADFEGAADREHVTPYFYRHAEAFEIINLALPRNLNDMQLSIDTSDDFRMIERLFQSMDGPHLNYGLDELVTLYGEVTAEAVQ